MAVIEFVQNYSDLSTQHGYQFKFQCDHCGNGYQSSFVPNQLDMAGGFLRAAGGLLGGVLGRLGDSAYDIQRAVGGPQHDHALQEAVAEIKPLFTQCRRCGTWVCREICWNADKGLCKQCAPILVEEIASAQATAARSQVQQKAQETDQTGGANVTQPLSLASCPQCGAAASGAKFCPECGVAQKTEKHCTECGGKMPASAKFCPECGTKS